MDWNLAIEKNREALKRILAMLVAMVVVGGSAPAPTLPRHLHRFVLRLLRPAEAAARRLIIVAARGLAAEALPQRLRKAKPQSLFMRNRLGIAMVIAPGTPVPMPVAARLATRTVSLPLLDPLKRWGRRRRVKQRSVPRITFDFDRPRAPAPPPLLPDDPLDADRLHRRLEAIGRVLDDLPRQAKRFARWQARRDAAATRSENDDAADAQVKNAGRIQRLSPMRPGRPPGWRRKPGHAVDEVLTELHGLAVWAMARPDTS